MDKELEFDISKIIESHKKLYLNSNSSNIGLTGVENNFRNSTPAAAKLRDELLIVANNYIQEKDIEDSEEIAQFIRDHVADFLKWCIVGDRK